MNCSCLSWKVGRTDKVGFGLTPSLGNERQSPAPGHSCPQEVSQACSCLRPHHMGHFRARAAPGKSGLHARGEGAIDGSPPGSPIPGILQARTLECQTEKKKVPRLDLCVGEQLLSSCVWGLMVPASESGLTGYFWASGPCVSICLHLPQRRVVWMWFGAFHVAFGLGRAQP